MFRAWVGGLAGLAVSGPAWAVCPPAPLDVARAAATDLTLAWIAADEAAGLDPVEQLGVTIPCFDRSPSSDDLVDLHRAMAIRAYFIGDVDAAGRSWAAVRQLAPDWDPPTNLLSPGSEPYRLFHAASTEPGERVRLAQRAPTYWEVDGERTDEVPSDRAFLLIGYGLDGRAQHSGYYTTPELVPLVQFSSAGRARRQARLWGTVAASATAVGAGVATGMALQTRATLFDEDTPVGDLRELQRKNHTEAAVAATLGVVSGVGLTVVWVVP